MHKNVYGLHIATIPSISLTSVLLLTLLDTLKLAWLSVNTPLCRFGRQYRLGSKTKARVVQLDWLWLLVHSVDNKENQSCKGQFPFRRFAIFEYHEEMFTILVNKNIDIDCLVPLFCLLMLNNMVKSYKNRTKIKKVMSI